MRKTLSLLGIALVVFFLYQSFIKANSFSGGTFTTGAFPPASETIAEAATVTANACGTFKQITADGSVTTSTTNTFTAPSSANAGCWMAVCNVGSNNVVLDNNENFKSAAAGDITVGENDCVTVISNGTAWYQTSALLAN